MRLKSFRPETASTNTAAEFGKKRAVEILTLLARVYAAFSAELNKLLQKE